MMFSKMALQAKKLYVRFSYWISGQSRKLAKLEESQKVIRQCGDSIRECRSRMEKIPHG